MVTAAGLKYMAVPMPRTSPDLSKVVDQFLAATSQSSDQPVYVHCGGGNRASALMLVRRVVVDGWSIEKATAEAEELGLTGASLKQMVLDYLKSRNK